MRPEQPGRSSTLLWWLLLLAAVYAGWLDLLYTMTGSSLFDGSIGVALGLFICSRPAANIVDLMFCERGFASRLAAEWSVVLWLLLNLLVFVVGWLVLLIGAARLAN
ncbi:MAG: hypothetical protein IT307_18280 [Chloroflexi bacterium]|nr:hypothetical protein [Chloroflexota bacterium]